MTDTLAHRIHKLLPQTQCKKCGYDNCYGYAKAIASNTANINECPTGGASGIHNLAKFLNRPVTPLNPDRGTEQPLCIAAIDEKACVGCMHCAEVCPVDAITRTLKKPPAISSLSCTGCALCAMRCPVDCISMINISGDNTGWEAWTQEKADTALRNYERHLLRIEQENTKEQIRLNALSARANQKNAQGESEKTATILAVIKKARAQLELIS